MKTTTCIKNVYWPRKVLTCLLLILASKQAFAAGSGITYNGRLIDPNGNAVVGNAVQFMVQIRTPGNENCLLYQEVQVKDLSQNDGIFSVTINDGTGTRLDASGFGIDQIFANRGNFNFPAGYCVSGSNYSPNSSDGRKIQVFFNDGSFPTGQWEPTPTMAINFIPMAIESQQIGGYKKEQLLKLADGVSTTGSELDASKWTNLLALINGTSTAYTKPSDQITQLYGASLPAPSNGQSIRWNSTLNSGAGGWENFTAGSSVAVTNVTAGTGLNVGAGPGGVITTTGTLNIDVGTTTGKIVQVAASNKLPAIDGSNLTNINASSVGGTSVSIASLANGQVLKYNGTQWVNAADSDTLGGLSCANGRVAYYSGSAWSCLEVTSANTINTIVSRDGSGSSNFGTVNTGTLKINDGVSGTISLTTPVTVTSYTMKLPTSVGTSGYALTTDGNSPAQLSWSPLTSGTVTSVTAGTGLNVGAGPGGSITSSGTINIDVGTTTGKIVQVAASNKLPTIDGSNLTNINASSVGGTAVSIASLTNGQVLKYNGTNWINATLTDNDTLGGLSCANGRVAYYTAGAWNCLEVTAANTINTIVTRDGSGISNFGTVNAGILKVNDGVSGEISLTSPPTVTSYSMKLPTSVGTSGYALTTDGNSPAQLSWSPITSSQWTTSGSDIYYNTGKVGIGAAVSANTLSVSGKASIGSSYANTAAPLNGLIVESNVGIGNSAPGSILDISGAFTQRGMTAPAVSSSGQGVIYFDSTANKFKISENGAAYVDLVGAAGGSGTVTSVGLSLPAEITVSNSPVTTSGTLTGAWASQTANKVFASPDGASGAPSFRALASTDIPNLDTAKLTTGTLSVGRGGTGATTLTSNGVLLGNGTSAVAVTAAGSADQVLRIPGAGGAPAFGAIDLTKSAAVTGALPVANGGTGQSSYTTGDLLYASGATALSKLSAGSSGYVLKSNGAGTAPSWQVESVTSNALSAITDASGSNSLSNAANSQTWNWSLTADTTAFALGESAASSGGTGAQNILKVSTAASSTANPLRVAAHGSDSLVVSAAGSVGVGNAAPRATLDVSGTIIGKASVSNATATIDFSGGNIQHTTADCGSFNLNNLKDGGTYMFIVKGTNPTTCSFSAYSDAGSTSLTVHLPPSHGAATNGKHTIYNLAVSGGDVYFSWIPGY